MVTTLRSPNETIFGKRVTDLHTYDRFSWTNAHNKIFLRHLTEHPDLHLQPILIDKLIAQLGLAGYENIETKSKHSVHEIIRRKVLSKVDDVRNEIRRLAEMQASIKAMGVADATVKLGSGLHAADNGQLWQREIKAEGTRSARTQWTRNAAGWDVPYAPTSVPGPSDDFNQAPSTQDPASQVAVGRPEPPQQTQGATTNAPARGRRNNSSSIQEETERHPEHDNQWWAFEGNNWAEACVVTAARPAPGATAVPDARPRARDQMRSAGRDRLFNNFQAYCMELPNDQLEAKTYVNMVRPQKPSLFDTLKAQDDEVNAAKQQEEAEDEEEEADDESPIFPVDVDHDKLYTWAARGLTRRRKRLIMEVLGKERGIRFAYELYMIQERIMAMDE